MNALLPFGGRSCRAMAASQAAPLPLPSDDTTVCAGGRLTHEAPSRHALGSNYPKHAGGGQESPSGSIPMDRADCTAVCASAGVAGEGVSGFQLGGGRESVVYVAAGGGSAAASGQAGYGRAALTAVCGQPTGGLAGRGHGARRLGREAVGGARSPGLASGRNELTRASEGDGGEYCLSGSRLTSGVVVLSAPSGGRWGRWR